MKRKRLTGAGPVLFAAALSLALAAPAWADFKHGERAFDAGDYAAAAVEWRPLAEKGDSRAQTNIGHLYRLGQGVERDYGEALKWYRLAADRGSARAQANLGNMYIEGLGVDADPLAGVALFRQAAELGFAVAQLYLGDFYRMGEVVVLDPEQAALWYRRAAEQGHPEAALRLGRLYLSGAGVATDEARAARWLREAAAFGLAAAQYELAELYRRGRGVEADLKEAMRWYHAAAGQGHVSAVERLAETGGGDRADDPNHQLRIAAEVGDPAAQMRLATMLREGSQMPRNATAALEWYRRAAAQGHARASYNLGLMYHDGDGVDTDDFMAAAWFRRAAKLGESDAQYTLGVFLSKGIGGDVNPAKAREWFFRAARQGDSRAQFSLGVMLEKGAGGAIDLSAALKWYSAAAEQGDLRAHARNAALTVEMAGQTPAAAEISPLDEPAEKALTESAAAALDNLDREDEAAGKAEAELAAVEPEVVAEPEAPAMVESVAESAVDTPPEAATMTVTVTSGTGAAKRVESLDRGETAGSGAPVIETNWFGNDDESEAEEIPAPRNVAVQQDADALDETPPETAGEPPEEDTVAVGTAIYTSRGEPTGAGAPDIRFDWFGADAEPEEPAGEAAPPSAASDENNAAGETDTALLDGSDDTGAAGDEKPADEGVERAVSALEAEIPANLPADTVDEIPAGHAVTDDAAPADPVAYLSPMTGREVDPPIPSIEYDLFQPHLGSSAPSDDDSIDGP